jgi:hypothetical protein
MILASASRWGDRTCLPAGRRAGMTMCGVKYILFPEIVIFDISFLTFYSEFVLYLFADALKHSKFPVSKP